MKKLKKKRKQIYSVTLDPDLVARVFNEEIVSNFSKFITEAIEEKIKRFEDAQK